MMKNPCKDCEKRKLGCHGFCQEYQAWKAELDEVNRKRYAEKENQFNNPPAKLSSIRRKMRWR